MSPLSSFYHRLRQAVIKARKELGIKGFCAVNGKSSQGKALYAKAKAIYAAWEVQLQAVWACVVVHGALNLPFDLLLQTIELSMYSSFRWATTRLAAVRDMQWKNCWKLLRSSFLIWYSVEVQTRFADIKGTYAFWQLLVIMKTDENGWSLIETQQTQHAFGLKR